MKKCKHCEGKGFVFDTVAFFRNKKTYGIPVLENKGVKRTCSKCYGKGAKVNKF